MGEAKDFENWATKGSPCGCHAVNIAQPVNFCPTHAAAPALVAAAKLALHSLEALAQIDAERTGVDVETCEYKGTKELRTALQSAEQTK